MRWRCRVRASPGLRLFSAEWTPFRSPVHGRRGGAKFGEPLLETVAIEQVERIEWDDRTVRLRDVDAGFFDGAQIERLRVDELHDQNAKDIAITQIARRLHLRQTAEQIGK